MRSGPARWRGYGWCCVLLASLAGLMTEPAPAQSRDASPFLSVDPATARSGLFKICHDQTYALCAEASCFAFNGVAYCTCAIKKGDSISLRFRYGQGKNVCSVNAEGAGNGYMVSTFSLPPSVVAPRGDKALYTCPAAVATGAYAQCDGGICFRSTQGRNFPGSKQPLKPNQIICSCPITVADPATATIGYQIVGPYPCRRGFFKNCGSDVANTQTGTTLHMGAPTGTPRLLTRLLDGSVPPINHCASPDSALLP
jgi:hypothetical protein